MHNSVRPNDAPRSDDTKRPDRSASCPRIPPTRTISYYRRMAPRLTSPRTKRNISANHRYLHPAKSNSIFCCFALFRYVFFLVLYFRSPLRIHNAQFFFSLYTSGRLILLCRFHPIAPLVDYVCFISIFDFDSLFFLDMPNRYLVRRCARAHTHIHTV